MMGILADAALEAGGQVTGVIPGFLHIDEVAHPGLTELITVDSMHARKALIEQMCDAAIALPGGFGTLDEEALDTALETLAGLQQEGKLIGLISHVPALKERIATQIAVTPQTGGRGVIKGPGCRRLQAGNFC